MITVEVKKFTRIMMLIKRVSSVVFLFVLSFLAYVGYTGVEYKLTVAHYFVLTLVPLLILFISGRWWEGLAGKEFIGLSFNNETVHEDTKKTGQLPVNQEAYTPDII